VDEKDGIIAAQAEKIQVLEAQVAKLTAENTELRARLNKNSKNSDKSPSSDGPGKGAPKNTRKVSGRKSGGQPGHKGVTKEPIRSPDLIQ